MKTLELSFGEGAFFTHFCIFIDFFKEMEGLVDTPVVHLHQFKEALKLGVPEIVLRLFGHVEDHSPIHSRRSLHRTIPGSILYRSYGS